MDPGKEQPGLVGHAAPPPFPELDEKDRFRRLWSRDSTTRLFAHFFVGLGSFFFLGCTLFYLSFSSGEEGYTSNQK
jgi:hypothetical protein